MAKKKPAMTALPDTIEFHSVLDQTFSDWAKELDRDEHELRELTRTAIRTRYHEAYIEHASHQPRGRRPAIYTLAIGEASLYYTVEPKAIMVRGYGWNIDGEPRDDFDGGGFYTEFDWSLQLADKTTSERGDRC